MRNSNPQQLCEKGWVGEKRNKDGVLVAKPVGKPPHERHRHRWEYNIEVNLKQ
jgi:hypothetical protein